MEEAEGIFDYRHELTLGMDRYFADQRSRKHLNHWQADVIDRLHDYVSGGKLLRGSLLCFSHQIFSGSNPKAARSVAIALELMHAALVIQDDIIDSGTVRRSQPAMHRQYQMQANRKDKAAHFGVSMAICVADCAIFMAMEIIGNLDITSRQKSYLLQWFGATLTTVSFGQMLDIEAGFGAIPPKKQTILTIMEQKTALYTLALPLVSGAILANQPRSVINQLESLGKILGTIFQIRDDELGIFGSQAKIGKPVGSDIKENKKTLPYYYLLRHASATEKKRLSKIFGNPNASVPDIEYVRQVMIKHEIPAKVKNYIIKLTQQTERFIKRLPVGQPARQNFFELLTFCAQREV